MGCDFNDVYIEQGPEAVRQAYEAAVSVPGPLTAAALQRMSFPPVRYIVPGYLPEGLTILAGRPKIGKSWAALGIAVAVAQGGLAFGSIQCEPGDVLYGALEDNLRRLKYRLSKVCAYADRWPERLQLRTDAPIMDENGVQELERWADSVANPRLIILDTFARVRRHTDNRDSTYESDYRAVESLHRFANERGLGVGLVHHVRKMGSDDPLDTVSGSTGFTGAADAVLVLTRDKSSADAILYGRGRDIPEIETAMAFDPQFCTWRILGSADDYRISNERREILEVLRNADGPMRPQEVAAALDKEGGAVRRMMTKMAQDGEIKRTNYGSYTLNPGNTGNTGNSWEDE